MSMDQTQPNGGAHSSKSSKNSKKGGDVPIPPCVFASPALAVSRYDSIAMIPTALP